MEGFLRHSPDFVITYRNLYDHALLVRPLSVCTQLERFTEEGGANSEYTSRRFTVPARTKVHRCARDRTAFKFAHCVFLGFM
jgi:hypothetical protein